MVPTPFLATSSEKPGLKPEYIAPEFRGGAIDRRFVCINFGLERVAFN